MSKLSHFFGSFMPSLQLLRKNDPLRMAGATAFFTTFALPPIVFLLAQLFGFFFTPRMIGSGLIDNLANNLGAEGADQVRNVIRSIRGFSNSWYVLLLGGVFLFFVATTLFTVIKNSFNQIWKTDRKENRSVTGTILGRLKSFAVILLVGILFLANLLFKSLETMGGNYIETFRLSSFYFKLIFSELTSIIIVSAWFIILFRFNSDGRPRWKAAMVGGLLTGILFSIGRYIMRILLINGNVGGLYGASGSFVLVLLFVFYTSFILYYGACFIKVYSEKLGWNMNFGRKK
ncbi:MAG: YihY/virulence factor BrkB family protein [Ferruginibacter sp.]